MFDSIQKENLPNRIIDAIQDYILQNDLKPGDRLATERQMAEDFGVSRTSVREAVKILEAIGVLESRPKHGISIREFDLQALLKCLSFVPHMGNKELVLQILELRHVVDLGLVDLVIERATEDDLEVMKREVEGMRGNLKVPVEFYTHDWAFHFAIYEASQNATIRVLGRFLVEFFVMVHRAQWDQEWNIEPEHFKNHERIYLALKNRCSDGMRQAIRDHFKSSLKKRSERHDFDFDGDFNKAAS